MTNPEIKVKRRSRTKKDSTQIQMMVESNTEAQYEVFNKEFIINSLSKECGMTLEDALSIANKVEQTLIKSDLKSVSSSYIRSLVNQILGDMGYDKWLKYSSLSIPLYDVKQIIEEHNMENSNTSFSPESVNLTLAGQIIQQYALREVFDPVVADAHLKGEIHLHDLSTANRPYCSGNSVSYIIKNGLKLPNIKTQSAPAQHALTLVNHLSCFTNYLQCYFSGAIGLDSVALFFAPFVINKTKKELKQIAQHLIYCFAQLAGARGGQTAFTDFNMHLRVPKHYADTPALGPGGEYTGKTYKEYENEMREFLRAIFEVLMDGDCNGANFAFPKILLHLDANSFDDNDEILDLACKVNSKRGSIYIIYDRGDTTKISMCCRLSIDMSDEDVKRMSERPEDNRFSALQNITINLPRIAYKYKNIADVQKEITRLLEIIMIGHKNKREYISSLLAQGEHGILGFLAKGMDGEPYLDINKVKYLVGMCGLNEMVKCISGEALHESESALKMGLHIIAYMNIEMNRLAEKHGIECLLEETPAESSLTFSQPIYIKDNDGYKKIKIGEFVESFFKDGRIVCESPTSQYIDISSLNIMAPSFSKEHKIENKKITKVVRHQGKRCYRVTLNSFKQVEVTGDHSVFTLDRNLNVVEIKADRLIPGDLICVPKEVQIKESDSIEDYSEIMKNIYSSFSRPSIMRNDIEVGYDLGYIIGLMLSEGHYSKDRQNFQFSNTDKNIIDDLANKINRIFGESLFWINEKVDIRYSTGRIYILECHKSLSKFLFDLGVADNQKYRKLPIEIIKNKPMAKGIIDGYIEGDGTYYINEKKKDFNITMTSISKDLIESLCFCLNMLGITYSVYKYNRKNMNPNWSQAYDITISGGNNLSKFEHFRKIEDKGGRDYIPYIGSFFVRLFRETLPHNQWIKRYNFDTKLYGLGECERTGRMSFAKAQRLYEFLINIPEVKEDKERINMLDKIGKVIYGGLIFEKVKSIFPIEEIPDFVYDISVEDNENFIGGEFGPICLHNTSSKFALIDIKTYPEAIQMVCGDVRAGNVYYTNSVHLQYDSHVDILTRIEKQAKFSPMIKAGSIIHNWFGQSEPDPMALKQLYKTTLFNTMANQTADSPDMTICRSCHTMSKGLDASCSKCGSTDVYSESRITGYYSVISGWTKGKLAELKDRVRVDFNMPLYQSKTDDIEKILFFSKPNCPKCDDLKKILTEKQIVLDIIDTQTPEGLGLGCYFGIDELPCLAKVKGDKVMSKISGKGSYLKWLKENK